MRENFIKEKEELYGGEITYITFATFVGSNLIKTKVQLNGVLFKIDNNLYFEDFEPRQHPLQFGQTRPEFNKSNLTINCDEIVKIGVISKKVADNIIFDGYKLKDNDIWHKKSLKNFLTGNLAFIENNSKECFVFNLLNNHKDTENLNKLF